MFRVVTKGNLYFVVDDVHITRAGPYDAMPPAALAAAWLNLKVSRAALAG